jgi:hypothetical protein
MFTLNIILSLVSVVVNVFVLVYLDRLERIGCSCSKDWRRGFAFAYLILSVLYTAFTTALTFLVTASGVGDAARHWLMVAFLAFTYVMTIMSILYVIFSLQYIHRLRDQKCTCSQHLTRDVWEILLYIYVAFFVLIALQVLILILTLDRRTFLLLGLPKRLKAMHDAGAAAVRSNGSKSNSNSNSKGIPAKQNSVTPK